MRRPLKISNIKTAEASLEELASLARLIVFAGETARDLRVEFPAYLLNLAHGAVVQEIQEKYGAIPDSWWGSDRLRNKPFN